MLAGASLWEITGIGMWAVTENGDARAIGHVGFFDFLRDCEPSIAGEVEIGWIFASPAQGRGYALEACQGILRWFDEHFGAQRIWALISPGNDPSMKLADKLGFIRQADGIYRDKPETIWLRAG
jgi:RimJ/RimL family protein N-acetyltransferase